MTSVNQPSALFLNPATFSPVQIEQRIIAHCFSGLKGTVPGGVRWPGWKRAFHLENGFFMPLDLYTKTHQKSR